jgi:hypothetical protein
MITYLAFLLSSFALLAASVAVLVVSGGWEAAAAGIGVLAGTVWLACFVRMVAGRDATPRGRGPRAV